jgi:predicted DNA-binding transcriptional regulator AlpA
LLNAAGAVPTAPVYHGKYMSGELNLQLIVILISTVRQIQDRNRLLWEWEVAQRLGISEVTLARWRKDRMIAHVPLAGTEIRYRQEDVERFIARNYVPEKPARKPVAVVKTRQTAQ